MDERTIIYLDDAIDAAVMGADEYYKDSIVEELMNVPPAQQRRTGRWIDHVEDGYVECPFCHSATNCDDNISDLHFCFSCGARMEESEE